MGKFERINAEDPMVTLCKMVKETHYDDLPRDVIDFGKKQILDVLAVTMGGSKLEGIPNVVAFVKEQGGKPESHIPFYGGKVPAAMAAFAIAPMSRAMDMGDTHWEAGHGSEYTFPTLLAALGLRENVTGKEFLSSFILAQELQIRVGIGYKFKSYGIPAGSNGGHYIFGAVAAVGKMMGLTLEALVNAQGIAKLMTQPHDSSMYNEGALMVRFHHGFIAQDAINVCLLTRLGITGPTKQILAGPQGFYSLFCKWVAPNLDEVTKGLGQEWNMKETSMKAYSACKCTHTGIDGLLEQMKEHQFGASDVDSIKLRVGSVNWNVVTVPKADKWNPVTTPQCQFSLPYVLATVVHEKGIFLDDYSEEAKKRRDVRNLMTRITAELDEKLPPLGTYIETHLKNGKIIRGVYTVEKGHPDNPLTVEDVKNKFLRCSEHAATQIDRSSLDRVIDKILNIEMVRNFAQDIILPLLPHDLDYNRSERFEAVVKSVGGRKDGD